MSELLTRTFLTALISGGLIAGVSLMFTALGETISERAGVLNIGLEGMMLVGAYIGFVGAYYGHSFWVGFAAGIAGGAFASLFMVVLCVRLGLDQIVVGIAITLAGEGITSVLQDTQFGSTYPRLGAPPTVAIPLLSDIPVLGKSVFDQPLIVYLGLAGVGAVSWIFRRTNAGLNLRAAGEKPEALDAAGVSVVATRSYAALCTGALAGLGGAYRKPLWVVMGSFLFGISLSVATALQLAGINISTDVVNLLPFIAIMVALVAFARRSYLPPALALPYIRGAR